MPTRSFAVNGAQTTRHGAPLCTSPFAQVENFQVCYYYFTLLIIRFVYVCNGRARQRSGDTWYHIIIHVVSFLLSLFFMVQGEQGKHGRKIMAIVEPAPRPRRRGDLILGTVATARAAATCSRFFFPWKLHASQRLWLPWMTSTEGREIMANRASKIGDD